MSKLTSYRYKLADSIRSFIAAESKWLRFELVLNTGKTVVVKVVAKDQNINLGEIRWYPSWRKYVFMPNQYTVYEIDCMEAIAEVITKLSQDRELNKLWKRQNSTQSVTK